eukprot:801224_1
MVDEKIAYYSYLHQIIMVLYRHRNGIGFLFIFGTMAAMCALASKSEEKAIEAYHNADEMKPEHVHEDYADSDIEHDEEEKCVTLETKGGNDEDVVSTSINPSLRINDYDGNQGGYYKQKFTKAYNMITDNVNVELHGKAALEKCFDKCDLSEFSKWYAEQQVNLKCSRLSEAECFDHVIKGYIRNFEKQESSTVTNDLKTMIKAFTKNLKRSEELEHPSYDNEEGKYGFHICATDIDPKHLDVDKALFLKNRAMNEVFDVGTSLACKYVPTNMKPFAILPTVCMFVRSMVLTNPLFKNVQCRPCQKADCSPCKKYKCYVACRSGKLHWCWCDHSMFQRCACSSATSVCQMLAAMYVFNESSEFSVDTAKEMLEPIVFTCIADCVGKCAVYANSAARAAPPVLIDRFCHCMSSTYACCKRTSTKLKVKSE